MKQPKKLTRQNKILLEKAGLDPEEWMSHFEDENYLHVVDGDRNIKIIDKTEGKVTRNGAD